MKKSIILLFVLGLFTMNLSAQSSKMELAFKTSYAFEKTSEFNKAAKELLAVYSEGSYELNLRLGWLLYNDGQHLESIKMYKKAAALMPYAIEPKFGLVYPLSALGNWDEVLNQYIGILKIDPSNTLVNYRIGLIYYNRKEYPKAIPYLQKVVNLYPFSYDGLNLLAWAQYLSGNTREAKMLFNRCLLTNPGDESSLGGLKLIK
jgi:tetratricopeptide (TPR) repeat protein